MQRGSRPTDHELVERARTGDADAYGELVRRHQQLAFRAAFLITGSAAEAEDAAQEGFVKAWKALGRFRPGSPFKPWVLRIVTNEARNRRRTAGRQARLAMRAYESDTDPSNPEDRAIAADQRDRLLAALNRLDERDRTAIAYRYFLELTEEEMARTLGVARGTVKSRLNRARRRLEETLAAPEEAT